MNWGHFKDPVCYLCLLVVLTSWSLAQEVEDLNNLFSQKKIVTELNEFSENI